MEEGEVFFALAGLFSLSFSSCFYFQNLWAEERERDADVVGAEREGGQELKEHRILCSKLLARTFGEEDFCLLVSNDQKFNNKIDNNKPTILRPRGEKNSKKKRGESWRLEVVDLPKALGFF